MVRFYGKKNTRLVEDNVQTNKDRERKIGKIQLAYLGVESTGTK